MDDLVEKPCGSATAMKDDVKRIAAGPSDPSFPDEDRPARLERKVTTIDKDAGWSQSWRHCLNSLRLTTRGCYLHDCMRPRLQSGRNRDN